MLKAKRTMHQKSIFFFKKKGRKETQNNKNQT